MRLKLLFIAVALFVGVGSWGQTLIPFVGSGSLTTNSWVSHSGTNGQQTILTTTSDSGNSLSFAGLDSSTGNRTSIIAGNSEDVNFALPSTLTGTIYYSALIKVLDATQLESNSTIGDYSLALTSVASATTTVFQSRIYFKKGTVASNFVVGILNNSGGTVAPSFVSDLTVNTTYLLVVKYNLTTNTASLFINPTPGANEPVASATNATGTTGAPLQIAGFVIRQGGNATAGTGNVEIDEIRVGSTWVSVTPAPAGITSKQTGNWSDTNTWAGLVVPTSTDNAVIANGHVVTMDTSAGGINSRNFGTTTTINLGGTLATNQNYINNGTTTVNGSFQIDQNGFGSGTGTWAYGGSSTLVFNHTSGVYGPIDGFHKYWPTTNPPFNVTINNSGSGGINLGVVRTVEGTYSTSASLTNTSNLTVNGTCQINSTAATFDSALNYGSSASLVYNVNTTMGRGNEWNNNPANVTLQNNSVLDYPNSWGTFTRTITGNLTIGTGSALYMDYGSPVSGVGLLTVGGNALINGNLSLGNQSGGDVAVKGNWTRANTAVFNPNGRAVTFNGTGTQNIAVTGGALETFNYLTVAGSGTLKFVTGTNAIVNSVDGLSLSSTHSSSTIDLNGQTLTMFGGGNLNLNSGNRFITSTLPGGIFKIGANTTSVINPGALTLDNKTTLLLENGSFNCGTGAATTINGILQINANGYITGNTPRYGVYSLLKYNSGGTYNRNYEWNGTTVPIGVPDNVQISNSTTLNYVNLANQGEQKIVHNLTIDGSSSLYMDYGSVSCGGPLNLGNDLISSGNLALGFVIGDDLKIGGNITFSSGYTFDAKGRAVIFTKAGTQTITASSKPTFNYVNLTSGTTTVQLSGTDLDITAPNTGNVISFSGAGDTFDINGRTLILGTSGFANEIYGSGTFKGGNTATTSKLTLLGLGTIGTLNFTSGSENIHTLTLNRENAVIGFKLGTPVTIQNSLVLTKGLIDLGTSIMTLEDVTTIGGTPSTNSYVIADIGGSTGTIRKRFTTTYPSFTFPIGDRELSDDGKQYSPATVSFTGATTYSTIAYISVATNDIVHPNLYASTYFISRYWSVNRSGTFTNPNYTFSGTYLTADINNSETTSVATVWDGANWTDGSAIGLNTVTMSGVTVLPTAATPNHFTAGKRDQEINVKGVTGTNPSIADGDTTPQGTDNTLFTTIDVGFSQEKFFRIQNLGTEVLNITSISMVGGTAPGDFAITGTFPTTIAGGAFLDFSVTFNPSAAGTRNTTLTIINDDSNEATYDFLIQGTGNVVASVDINVKGNGQSIPDNSIYPLSLNYTAFGTATVGVTTVTRTFTIQNLGSSTLSLTGSPLVNIIGPHAALFTVTLQPPSSSILGGNSLTFDVKFDPNSPGTKNATIVIANNDSDENPYNFNISGTAKGNKNIYVYGNGNEVNSGATTTSLTNLTNFGSIALTTGVKQNTFVISNLSGTERYFSNVTISGPDAAMFTVVSQTPANALNSGNSTSFTINFTPTSVGTKNAIVTFSSYTNSAKTIQDASDPSTYTFAISGVGIVYTVCNIGTVQTIAQQDFEDIPATPTLGYAYTTEGLVSLAGGTFNNGSGSKNAYIDAKSFQVTGIGTASIKTTVVNLNAIDVSKYVNINLSFKTGAFRTGTTQGLDVNDFIQVESSIDGGVNWSTESTLRAYNNSRWDFNATGVFNSYYTGTNNGATIDSRNGNAELANGYASYSVKNLPRSSNLLLRLTLVVDRDDEIWAIDNIKIEGQLPQSTTWNGTAWSSGVPPTSSTKAIFDGNYTTSVATPSVKACECQINATRVITVSADDYLEIQSDITNYGTLTIKNDGSLVQVNDDAVNTGNISYERITPPVWSTDYTYWSSPVSPQTLYNVSPTTLAGMFYSYDDTTQNWIQEASSNNMIAGKGYIIRGPEQPFQNPYTATFIGKPNNGVYSISGVDLDRSYLLGNPYPSALDADTFLDDNSGVLDGTLYFWTHKTLLSLATSIPNPGPGWAYTYSLNDYAAYNLTGGVGIDGAILGPGGYAAPNGGTAPTGIIASGQGFFASSKTSALTGSSIIFNNSMRVGVIDISKENNSQFFKTKNTKEKTATIEKHRIWLNLTNTQGAFKQTLVGYITDATNEYDSRFDGESFDGNEFIDFYSVNQEKNLVIQGRALPFSENDEVPLGFRTTIEVPFTINIDQIDGALTNQAVFIEDKLTNTVFDLKAGNYTFNTLAGTFNDRFVLRYTNKTLSNKDFETLENQVLVSNKNKQIKVNSAVETIDKVVVYDLLGRQLFKKDKVNSNELALTNLVSSQQTLLVKVSLQNGQTVTKKIIY